MNTKMEEAILKKMKKFPIESVYLYGSVLRTDFNSRKSDTDLFIILKNHKKPEKLIYSLKKEFSKHQTKLDLNFCFLNEFKLRIHVDRPVSYFIGIKKASRLLYGRDWLKEINENELNLRDLVSRAISLSQRLRHSYLNNIDTKFWLKKSRKWLQTLVLESLFLEGEFQLDYKKGITTFHKNHPQLKTNLLLKNNYTIKKAILVAEKMKNYLIDRNKHAK